MQFTGEMGQLILTSAAIFTLAAGLTLETDKAQMQRKFIQVWIQYKRFPSQLG